MPQADTRILYDRHIGGVRVVKASLLGHTATFTCNEALRHCTVQVEGRMPLAPDIGYAKGHFTMHYRHVAITPETETSFEAAYAAAKKFCSEAGPEINRIRAEIENERAIL